MIWQQLEYVSASVAAGVIIVFLYDILLVLREIIRHGQFMTALEDVLFWLSASVAVFFLVIYRMNEGALRGYAAAGLVIGMFLSHIVIGSRMIKKVKILVAKVKNRRKQNVRM